MRALRVVLATLWLLPTLALATPTDDQLKAAFAIARESASLHAAGHHAQALAKAQEAVQKVQAALGPHHPLLARLHGNVAAIHESLEDWPAAESAFAAMLDVCTRSMAVAPRDMQACLGKANVGIGFARVQLGDPAGARPRFASAVERFTQVHGDRHPDTLEAAMNLAHVEGVLGLVAEAAPRLGTLAEVAPQLLGPQHPMLAALWHNQAVLRFRQGNLALAQEDITRAVDRYRAAAAPSGLLVQALTDRGTIQLGLGELEAAEADFQAALAMAGALRGNGHAITAQPLNGLGQLALERGDVPAALARFEAAMQTLGNRLDSLDRASIANNLGRVALELERDDLAERMLREALRIRTKGLGKDAPALAVVHAHLGWVLARQGKLLEAKTEIERAVQLWGPNAPPDIEVVAAWHDLALVSAAMGDSQSAWTAARQAMRRLGLARKVLLDAPMAEATRLAVARRFERLSDHLVDLAMTRVASHPEDKQALLELLIDRKGAVLDASMALPTSQGQVQALRQRLRTLTGRLAATFVRAELRGVLNTPADVGALVAERERVEGELARVAAGDAGLRLETNAYLLCKGLAPKVNLVELVVHERPMAGLRRMEQRLSAVVVAGGDCAVSVRSLGPWEPIARDVMAFRKAIAAAPGRFRGARGAAPYGEPEPTESLAERAGKLHAALVAPWRQDVQGAERVLLAADDLLSFLPFAALIGPDGEPLLESLPLEHVDGARELIRGAVLGGLPGKGALILADPTFVKPGHSPAAGCRELAATVWPPLPGTRKEAELVAKAFRSTGVPAVVQQGNKATESAVGAARGKRYLALMTHGYYAPDACGTAALAASRQPMLASGLVLAADARSDGWLTAAEVAQLPLDGVELAVLSACDTGLGRLAGREGVQGLRRGLRQAGVRGVVQSLWQVDDEATAELMASFWQRLLACKPGQACGPGPSLREAQRALRKRLMKTEGADAPYAWAAFAYFGDGR